MMSTVVCAIASRAVKPERYLAFLEAADRLIQRTFQGPAPDLLCVKAIMLLSAWTGRARVWGYVASLASELKLHVAALQLDDESVEQNEELVDRARTWFTLCCFDLQ